MLPVTVNMVGPTDTPYSLRYPSQLQHLNKAIVPDARIKSSDVRNNIDTPHRAFSTNDCTISSTKRKVQHTNLSHLIDLDTRQCNVHFDSTLEWLISQASKTEVNIFRS